jgi:hypothetical protein
MVVPTRLHPEVAKRRFEAARHLAEQGGGPATTADTLSRIEQSLHAALAARDRLIESAKVIDQAAADADLKQAIRRHGAQSPEAEAIRRRRQVAVEIQDEIDAVDRHINETVLDVEALAAEAKASAARFGNADAAEIGRRMQHDLEQLRADTAALDAARRELDGL